MKTHHLEPYTVDHKRPAVSKSVRLDRANANRCPFCNGSDVAYHDMSTTTMNQECYCPHCRKRWVEHFSVTSIKPSEWQEA